MKYRDVGIGNWLVDFTVVESKHELVEFGVNRNFFISSAKGKVLM